MKTNIVILLALILVGCAKQAGEADVKAHPHDEGAGHDEGRVELTEEAQRLANIQVEAVRSEKVQPSIVVPGTVSSTDRGRAIVTPPVPGRVISISVRLGDQVRQGQTLAVIESPELSQAWSSVAEASRLRDSASTDVEQAYATVQLAEAKCRASKAHLARQRSFAKAGAFSQIPLQQALNDMNDAQSDLLSLQEEYTSHSAQFRRLNSLFREGIVAKAEVEGSRLELQQDEIRLSRAKARVETAKASYDREKGIASGGLLNAKELQSAEAEVTESQLELSRAKIHVKASVAQLESAKKAVANALALYRSTSGAGIARLGRVELLAPIPGTITHVDVTQGQAVERTQVLLEVENLSSVWVTASIPERDAQKVQPEAQVWVTVPSLPGREFRGAVQIVGARVDSKTRSIPAHCLIVSPERLLKPDMFASVRIGLGKHLTGITVPRTALVEVDRSQVVFRKRGSAFERVEVTVGERIGDRVVVTTGLSKGDEIASQGSFVLKSELMKDELKGHED